MSEEQMNEAGMLPVQLACVRAAARGANVADIVAAIDAVKNTRQPVGRLVAFHTGDGSVGLPGDHATVDLDLSGYAADVAADIVERAKILLRPVFSDLWDARAIVVDGVDAAL